MSAAPPAGSNQPILFETERSTGIRAGKLKQVVSLWPGRDEYIDHTTAYAAGDPVLPFARSLLFGLEGHDPMVFTLAVVLLAAIAALAGYVPARRAAQIDPMLALRYD